MSRESPKPIGSSFDSWLEEEGIQADVDRAVGKQLLPEKIERARKQKSHSRARQNPSH